MRLLTIPLVLLTASCWTPGPGEVDPTRYPWDQTRTAAASKASYCIMSLETPSSSGITTGGGDVVHLACKEPPVR